MQVKNPYSGAGVVLGQHPDSGVDIRLKRGRYGYYLQIDVPGSEPKKVSLPGKMVEAGNFDLAQALELLRYPWVRSSDPPSCFLGLSPFSCKLRSQAAPVLKFSKRPDGMF